MCERALSRDEHQTVRKRTTEEYKKGVQLDSDAVVNKSWHMAPLGFLFGLGRGLVIVVVAIIVIDIVDITFIAFEFMIGTTFGLAQVHLFPFGRCFCHTAQFIVENIVVFANSFSTLTAATATFFRRVMRIN